MKISPINKEQALKIAKATAYVGVSAMVDYLISITSGTQFGALTPVINIALVTVKQLLTEPKE